MDKSWVHCTKLSSEYEDGIEEFMKFAIGNSESVVSLNVHVLNV